MSVPYFQLGAVAEAYKRNLSALAESRAVSRLWQKDLSLWPANGSRKHSGSETLNWLDLSGHLEPAVTRIVELASKLSNRGIQDVVFLALSSSSLAADLIPALGLSTRGVRFHAVSSLEPSGLRALESRLDFTRTLFLVASKSGKNLEMHALLLYFLAKVKSAGVSSPGSLFVAITEDGSYLAALATQYRFQAVLTESHGFRGRFSGVQHYGLLLAGFCGLNLPEILAGIQSVRDECVKDRPIERNPAATLAAFLAALVQSGFYRLVFRAPPPLAPLAGRLGHLVGSSSCKNGTGLLPFAGSQIADAKILDEFCAVCDIQWNDESLGAPPPAHVPFFSIPLKNIESIPGEVFRWELTVSLACSLLGLNPFADPDYLDGRDAAMKFIEIISQRENPDTSRARIVEGSLSLFVEGDLRHDLSSLNLEQALASFFALPGAGGYCAFLNFLWDTPDVSQRIDSLVAEVGLSLGIPAQSSPGPRYLHLLGQCYKGGPRGGIALMLTGDPIDRADVPGAGYTLADLRLALALGDMDAMVARHRHIVRLHLAGPPATSLAELESLITRALKSCRRSH
jgi:hypothetical protein